MHATDVRGLLPRLRTFEARLTQGAAEPRPLLVVRLPELERVAWRRGLRAARALERAAAAAFSTAVASVLRADDLVAHDSGSDVFLAALTAPTREGGAPIPVDARSALARIAATMQGATRLDVHTGWTAFDPAKDAGALDRAVERALDRGAQERERYAFFSSLGHELRTPLSSIRGYLETLLDDGVDDATRERFVRIAYSESLRLSRLVEGMFEISLLDMRETKYAPAIGSLADAIEAAQRACAANAAARQVGIAIDDVPSLQIAIDTDRLTLVLVNLIDNAVKHGRSGGGVFVGIAVEDRRFVRITVDDDGPGIAAIDRERVFALGERATTSANGSGIGLALVRLMLERAGGRVELEESPLGGARFTLTVPCV